MQSCTHASQPRGVQTDGRRPHRRGAKSPAIAVPVPARVYARFRPCTRRRMNADAWHTALPLKSRAGSGQAGAFHFWGRKYRAGPAGDGIGNQIGIVVLISQYDRLRNGTMISKAYRYLTTNLPGKA